MGSDATRQDGNTQHIDLAAVAERLRRMRPTVWDVLADLVLSAAGIGFVLLVVFHSADRRSLPGFAVLPLVIGFGAFVRFLDHLTWRSRLGRLLRDCEARA